MSAKRDTVGHKLMPTCQSITGSWLFWVIATVVSKLVSYLVTVQLQHRKVAVVMVVFGRRVPPSATKGTDCNKHRFGYDWSTSTPNYRLSFPPLE